MNQNISYVGVILFLHIIILVSIAEIYYNSLSFYHAP
jgi:hypothetical protein